MHYNKLEAKRYIFETLAKQGIKYAFTDFASGASMVDVWYNNKFYVIQLETESIGLSLVDDNDPGFDTIPGESFFEFGKFAKRLNEILV